MGNPNFQFIEAGATPAGCLTWRTPREKSLQLHNWRTAVMRTFPEKARVVRIAWTMDSLFTNEGYCFASNGFFSERLLIDPKNVERAMKILADAGAIIRVHVRNGAAAQRRIFAGAAIVAQLPPA